VTNEPDPVRERHPANWSRFIAAAHGCLPEQCDLTAPGSDALALVAWLHDQLLADERIAKAAGLRSPAMANCTARLRTSAACRNFRR